MKPQNVAYALKVAYQQGMLNIQQYKTLKGQVFSGNINGAIKGFKKLTKHDIIFARELQ